MFAKFQMAFRRDWQVEGIAMAKSEGRHNGRPASIDVEGVPRMKSEEMRLSRIVKALVIGRASEYRALETT